MNNPLMLLLEKADLAEFQKELEKTQQSALDIRLDGVNLFTAIILCNAPVDTKLKLFSAAKRQYLTEHDDIQRYIDEEIARNMEERYTVVVNRLKEKKPLLEYIAKRLLEKETIDKQEFDDIIKAESQLPRQPAIEAPEAY